MKEYEKEEREKKNQINSECYQFKFLKDKGGVTLRK